MRDMDNATYPRALGSTIRQDMLLYPVVVLVGARQVGKSTLGREIAASRGMAYRTLDDRDVLAQAREDPEGLLAELDGPGFVDEAQRAPELFLAMKAVVDRDQRPGQYLLSGSNQPRITGAVGDSLLGRAAYRILRPLSLSELRLDEVHRGWDFLFQRDDRMVFEQLDARSEESGALDWRSVVQTGGFPRAVAVPPVQRRRLLDDYVQVYANRDIREILSIESSDRFEQFLRLLAARTGQVLNANGLAADLGIPVTTIRRWLGALQRSFLLELIPAYSRNASMRVIKAPKQFLVDPALALAAAREPEPTGFHLENLIAIDLAIWKDIAPGRSVHHWRLQSGQEVDFILEMDGGLLAVEVKTTTHSGRGDARHLGTFMERHPDTRRGLLLSADPHIRMISDRVIAAPWWAVV